MSRSPRVRRSTRTILSSEQRSNAFRLMSGVASGSGDPESLSAPGTGSREQGSAVGQALPQLYDHLLYGSTDERRPPVTSVIERSILGRNGRFFVRLTPLRYLFTVVYNRLVRIG